MGKPLIRPLLAAMRSEFMDIALSADEGRQVRIIERPGLWMDEDARAALREELAVVARAGLPGQALDYGVFAPDGVALKRSVITLVKDADGTPIAFNALVLMEVETEPEPIEVLHLGLVMVVPGARKSNLSWVLYGLTCFMILLRRRMRPVWISNVTQVPAVVGMVCEMFTDVWPRPGAVRGSLMHLMLGRRIAAGHRHVFGVGPEAGFDSDRFVLTDAYTGGSDALKKTLDEAADHRDPKYTAFCAQELDYMRGDDLLQLGRMDIAAMRTYLLRQVPRSAVPGLLVAGAIVALQRLVLPVLHWAEGDRAWSILRPAGRA